jgi:two-component system, NtrC family, sensor kinase
MSSDTSPLVDHRLLALEEASPDAIVYETLEGTITRWSRGAEHLIGYTGDEMVGRSSELIIPAHDRVEDRNRRERVARGSHYGPLETRWLNKDGAIVDIELASVPLRDDSGASVGMVTIARDLTARNERAASLALTERMSSLSHVASGVMHGINNPLAFLAANLEMLDGLSGSGAALDAGEVSAMMRDARSGVERIKRVVRALGAFARASDVMTRVNVVRVLRDTIDLIDFQLFDRARLVTHFAPLPELTANEGRIATLFVKLLVYIARAFQPGVPELSQLAIATRIDTAGWALVELHATGPSVGPVVDPTGALGVELALCGEIVRSIGGTMTFELDAGHRVRVTWPTEDAPSVPGRSDQADSGPTELSARARVLVVDDDVVVATSLRRLLARDYDVVVEHSAVPALQRFVAGEQFAAIVCDVQMPGMSGIELVQALQARSPHHVPRFIFVTGGDPAAARSVANLGPIYFEKPFDVGELRRAVRRLTK